MPREVDLDLPTNFPEPDYLTIDSSKRGVITLIDKSRLPKNALEEANNLFLAEDGQPTVRPGVNWFGTEPVAAVTTSYANPTAAASMHASFWANPTNVFSSNDTYATYDQTNGALAVTGFGFAIPSDSTIAGIEVKVEGNGEHATPLYNTIQVALTKDGSVISGSYSSDQILAQDVDTTLTFGSTTSMFSTTLTPAEVNASTFGIFLRRSNNGTGFTNDELRIDHVQVRVTYRSVEEMEGFDYFDFDGAIHLVVVAGGGIVRSTDDGVTWDACSGATLTAGVDVNMNQNGGYLYITNGVDEIVRYDGTTTLQTYTALTTPAAPTVVETGSGLTSGTSYQYYYKCSRVNQVGFSIASDASTVIQTGLARESWSAGTNYATLTLPALSGTQTRFDVYISTDAVNYFYLGSTSTTTFVDDGSQIIIPGTSAPTDNTTQGPKVAELVNVGSRQYGVRDGDNRYRIWFTGVGNFAGAFSTAYDGGYLDWQEGGKYIPVKVEDYRDGKGTPLATIWCKSADGQGCILQMSLDTFTVDDISVTVPSAYRLPGSRGTPAPKSVVNVLNDYMFYNSQAFYNLGSRAQFLNLLSTDESSANIRPTVKQITKSAESGIASIYFDARVYFSVPYGSSTNNFTAIYDTERRAWLPKAFTLGFKKFLRYTDVDGNSRLLALKSGDTRLSEISSAFLGDYGEAFSTSLKTGLYPTTKNRFEFQWVEEGEVEFSNPQGRINVELVGVDRSRGFSTAKSETVDPSSTNTGWGSFLWDTTAWDDTTVVPDTFSESSVKRYFTVQKELNAVQWVITTNTVDAQYVLRTLQTWGTRTLGGKPRSWRI